MPDLQPDEERQATASIRGYSYQCYQTIVAWLNCGPDEEIRCEFAEDFDLVRRDSNHQVTEAELNQAKHEKQNVTLNGDTAIELINNFFRHRSRSPGIKLKIRLCAIANRGKEMLVDWQHASCGLDLWDLLKSRELNLGGQAKAIEALRSFLRSNSRYSSDVQGFLNTVDDATFMSDFVDRISWDTGQLAYGEMEHEIREILSSRIRPISDPIEIRQTIDRLWRCVMDLMATSSDRTLRKEDLERLLSEETTTTIDRGLLREFTSGLGNVNERMEKFEESLNAIVASVAPGQLAAGDSLQVFSLGPIHCEDLPSLPRMCAPRDELINSLHSIRQKKNVLWIHGSTGFGKTTIANLLVRELGRRFLWFRLRNLKEFELLAGLHEALKKVAELSTPVSLVIVLDDVALSESDTNGMEEIDHIVRSVQEKDSEGLVVITSQASAPSRFGNIFGEHLGTLDMPAMSDVEIAFLLDEAGLEENDIKNSWLAFIQARTQGHPQLVSAYISYAREIKWKLSAERLTSTPTTAEIIKREARQLLTQSIHSPEARELAKRLSVVGSYFSREFALFVARIDPKLHDAGHAFDSLVGPWIEELDNNQYSLSPLLEGYAASDVGDTRLTPYHRMAAYGWFSTRKLNPSQFMQMVISAFLADEEFLVAHASIAILKMDKARFKQMSKYWFLLPLIGLDGTSSVDRMRPITRYLFRSAQLRVAKANEQWPHYGKLDLLIVNELEASPGDLQSRNSSFTHYLSTSVRKNTPLVMRERIRRSIRAVELAANGLVDAAYVSSFEQQTSVGSVVLLTTSDLETYEDLAYMFGELERQAVNVVKAVFAGFTGYPDLLTLLMDRVWLNESKKDSPEWDKCLILYARIAEFACLHDINWLFGAAIRAQAIINDEYLNNPQRALTIIEEARTRSIDSHVLLDLAESTVCFHQGNYSATLELLRNADQDLSPNLLTMERVFTVKRAILSAAKNDLWEEATAWATRGLQLAEALPDSAFPRAAKIAFWGEIGWSKYESKNRVASVEAFEKCLKLLQEFPDRKDSLAHFLHYRLGQVLGWLSGFASYRLAEADIENRPFCGMFADFGDPTTDILDKRCVPYEGCWGMLAKYAAWFSEVEKVKDYADSALVNTPDGQCFLGVWTAREAKFAAAMSAQDHTESLSAGLLYLRSLMIVSLPLVDPAVERSAAWDIGGYGAIDAHGLTPAAMAKWAESFPSEILEPILMSIMSSAPSPAVDLDSWRRLLVAKLGPVEQIDTCIEWLDTAARVIAGDSEAIRKTEEIAWNGGRTQECRRLALTICCGSKFLEHGTCLVAQLSFFNSLPLQRRGMAYGHAFTRMVASRWSYLAKEQTFLIGSPGLFASAILQAASQVVPTFKECANLLLLVVDAVRLRVADDLLNPVKRLAQGN